MKSFRALLVVTCVALVVVAGLLPSNAACSGVNVRHDYGESCVPKYPKRVVVIDETALDIALALEIKPIARVRPNLVGDLEKLYGSRLDGVTDLGIRSQPNLEVMLGLKPDLILNITNDRAEAERYARIAPTLAFSIDQTGWKGLLRRAAGALGRQARADLVITNFERRARELRARIGEARVRSLEVGVVQLRRNVAHTRFRTRSSFPGTVLAEIGFAEPKQQKGLRDTESPYYLNVSLERLDLLDADAIFLAIDPGSEASVKQVLEHPLWSRLRAVSNNMVHTVPTDYWVFGNINAANAMLGDIERAFVKR